MCGGVNDSDSENIYVMIKLTSHCSSYCYLSSSLIFALGEHGLSFLFFFFRWVVDTPNSTVGHLSIFSTQVGIIILLILLWTLVHFYLSSHSVSFFSRFRVLSPFYFLVYFCITHASSALNHFRERITILGTVSDNNIFSNFNEWWLMV